MFSFEESSFIMANMKILIYGSVNIDNTFKVNEIVKPGETVSCTFSGKAPGGKGANQAYAAGKASGGRFEVFFAGKADDEASFIFEKMEKAGVNCKYVSPSEFGTGMAVIQVAESGQNSILVCGNGNVHIEKNEIDSVLENFGEGDCVILNAEINNLEYLMNRCFEKKMTVFFNPSPVTQAIKNLPLEKASYLVFNEVEGAFFADMDDTSDYKGILAALRKKYPSSNIVLTMGENGAWCNDDYVPAMKVKAVDTTGCGDTFLGFFATEVMSGEPIKKALEIASKAASIAATRAGAMNSIPDYKEVI